MAANILADNFSQESSIDVPRDRAAEVCNQIRVSKTEMNEDPTVMNDELPLRKLQEACGKLKNKKSPGKDGITNEMIKNLGNIALQKLLYIYTINRGRQESFQQNGKKLFSYQF